MSGRDDMDAVEYHPCTGVLFKVSGREVRNPPRAKFAQHVLSRVSGIS